MPPTGSHSLSLAEVSQKHTVYLVEVEDEDELAQWLVVITRSCFRQELNGWYTDSALWPRTGPSRCFGSGVPLSSIPWWWTPVKLRSKTTSSKNEASRTTTGNVDQGFFDPYTSLRDRGSKPARATPWPS